MTNKISNAQLLKDIVNTRLEIDAYYKLKEGYKILSVLNVGEGGSYIDFQHKSDQFNALEIQCNGFLNKLLELKIQRGL